MNVGPNLSKIASIIADASRGKMLALLMNLDGMPATELAAIAGVTPQTASSHLGKMLSVGLIKLTKQGRHKYYSIASDEVADTLEKLAFLAPAPVAQTTAESVELRVIKMGRTCYGHLAGKIGVALYDRFIEQGLIKRHHEEILLTKKGEEFFADLGIEVEPLRTLRRKFACPCLDWTERKHHLAGALGKALADHMFQEKWIRRVRDSRAIVLTEAGKKIVAQKFAVDLT